METLSVTAAGLVHGDTALVQPSGRGPSMMGGHGMSSGWMRDSPDGAFASLKLNSDQREKIAEIQATSSAAIWQLMGTMHEQESHHMQGMYGSRNVNEAAARKSFQAMAESRQAMFTLQLDTRKKIDDVLTKEQREQLAQYGHQC